MAIRTKKAAAVAVVVVAPVNPKAAAARPKAKPPLGVAAPRKARALVAAPLKSPLPSRSKAAAVTVAAVARLKPGRCLGRVRGNRSAKVQIGRSPVERWRRGRLQSTEYGELRRPCKGANRPEAAVQSGVARLARSANPTKRQGQHVVRSLPRGRAIPYPLSANRYPLHRGVARLARGADPTSIHANVVPTLPDTWDCEDGV